ncbi:MAG TPA: hypothetical protein DDZ11_11635, partial [Lentisphaeria bacterium]|nr:hypothetical protein [Lentisphaeria bacterium]
MLRDGAQNQFISRRVSMPTEKSHAELVRDVDAGVKARSFFSARVADARRLENIRKISDAYSRGEMSLGEARNILKESLRAEGFNPHEGGLRNLAGTARLNLILRQNASMAHAAGEWARMHDPDAMAVFPYVRYHARSDRRTRSEHAHLDGKIFRKDDPFLRTHTPPWEFNCRCWLEEITAKAAGKTPELIQKPTPPEKVTVDSRSGFVFDPARAFEEFDLSGVRSAEERGNIREAAEIEFGDQMSFGKDNAEVKFVPKQYPTYKEANLPEAKTWTSAPAPERIAPEDARKRLEAGFEVKTADGRTAIMDQAVLDHWEKETAKPEKAVNSRLGCLNYAVETLRHPTERWDQETQCRYLKKFQKATGGYEGCMVCVTNDGKCRTYFLPSIKQMDGMRNGIGHQEFKDVSSTGRDATRTTEAIAAPGRSDDRNHNNTPSTEKVKGISSEYRKKRQDQKKRAWDNRVERSGLPEAVQRELKDFNIGEIPKMPRLVLDHPDFQNTGYAPQSNILNIRHTADVSDISHELTHVWQIQRQKIFPDLREEIRNAQKKDWERLKKVWGGKVGDYDLERISTQNRL